MDHEQRTLTAVPGLQVGHAHRSEARTGCTVVLGPFTAAVEVSGLATGSRELDALSLLHLVPACDAVLLTGGSAFGLAAAEGVMGWLEERGRGFSTPAARVPIVPAAVIYDLAVGRADVRPDAALGRAAAEAASTAPVREGAVGVGAGATVGKLRGAGQPAGIGTWAERTDGIVIGALAVVNAFGDVLAGDGRILAGARDDRGGFLDTARFLREHPEELASAEGSAAPRPGESTTLAVVATDLPLSKRELMVLARQASRGLARRISPSGTPFDGDLVFAVSTGAHLGAGGTAGGAEMGSGREPESASPLELLSVSLRAQAALEQAVERAVSGRVPSEAPRGSGGGGGEASGSGHASDGAGGVAGP